MTVWYCTKKLGGSCPQPSAKRHQNVLCFFCAWPVQCIIFGHMDFCHFGNRHESVSWCIHRWEILKSKFCRPVKQFFEGGGLVPRVLLKGHNFGWWVSFQGLADIPRICVFCACFLTGDVLFGTFWLWHSATELLATFGSRIHCAVSDLSVSDLSDLSVLWRCWLGGRKGIRPVKNWEWWGVGMVVCLERGADLHMAQRMPLPLTVSCFS